MSKSTFRTEYQRLVELLRETRKASGMTQIDLAAALGQTQSYVSKVERGELRLDVIQLREICQHLGTTLPEFIAELERDIDRTAGRRTPRKK